MKWAIIIFTSDPIKIGFQLVMKNDIKDITSDSNIYFWNEQNFWLMKMRKILDYRPIQVILGVSRGLI